MHAGSAYVPNEVIVRYAPSATRAVRASAQRSTGAGQPKVFAPYTRVLKIRDGESVDADDRRAGAPARRAQRDAERDRPRQLRPQRPGPRRRRRPAAGRACSGTSAPRSASTRRPRGTGIERGRAPGRARRQGRGARHRRRLREPPRLPRSPDLLNRFLKGYDFVDDDAYPDDLNGHGTHVASTIARDDRQRVRRHRPRLRRADHAGAGARPRRARATRVAISAGIRYAARKGAKVINLSFEFDSSVTRGQIPDILDALRFARRKGALVVGASGNFSAHAVAYPARASHVMSVGATTEHCCQADYSNAGTRPRHRRARRRADADVAERPELPPRREPAGPRHLPDDLHQPLGAPLRAAGRLRRHVDGGAARVGHRRARDRLRRDRPAPDARPGRGAAQGDGHATSARAGRDSRYGAGPASTRRARSPPSARCYVVRMISTLQGAWCETLFGTEPSRKRLAPVMPLLPTTIRSALRSSATSRIASAGSPSRAKVSTFDARALDLLGRVLERRLDVLARVDHPLHVLRHLALLLAQALVGHRLVRGDEADRGADLPRQLRRLQDRLARGLGSVRPHHDRAEHGARS